MKKLIEHGFSPVLFIGMSLDEIILYLSTIHKLPPESGEVDEKQEYDLFLFGSRHLGCKLAYLEEPDDIKHGFTGLLGSLDLDNSRFMADMIISPKGIILPKSNAERITAGIDPGTRITLMEFAKGSKLDIEVIRGAGGLGVSILPFNCYVRGQDNVADYTPIRNK